MKDVSGPLKETPRSVNQSSSLFKLSLKLLFISLPGKILLVSALIVFFSLVLRSFFATTARALTLQENTRAKNPIEPICFHFRLFGKDETR